MRIASVEDDPVPSSPDGVSGKTGTPGQASNETDDEDGIMRLKKASGLMGCLR